MLDQKKNTLAADSDRSKRSNSHSASSDWHDETAGERVDAEQGGQPVDDAARRAERRRLARLRQRAHAAGAVEQRRGSDAERRIGDEHQA